METQENKQNLPETAETQDFSGYDDSAEFAKEQAEREEKKQTGFSSSSRSRSDFGSQTLKKIFYLKKDLDGETRIEFEGGR